MLIFIAILDPRFKLKWCTDQVERQEMKSKFLDVMKMRQSSDVVIESLESETSRCNSADPAEPSATKKRKKSSQLLSYILILCPS